MADIETVVSDTTFRVRITKSGSRKLIYIPAKYMDTIDETYIYEVQLHPLMRDPLQE